MRIIKSSKNIKASDSYNLDDETYKYVTNVDGYWVYRAIVDGKGVWRAMPQDSDESQFEELSFPISYDQARGFEPIDEPSAITKLRKDLGKKLLPKAGQSVEATEDLSMYPESFKNAYTVAKKDFKKDYKRAHADVQIYPSDPYLGVEEGEIVLQITGFTPYGKKCSGTVSVDESLDSNILYQAMKETAEDLGIRKGSFDIKNSTGSTIKANKSSSVRLQMKEELMDQILSEIKSKLKEVMTSPKFGFPDNEWEDYSGADIYLNNDGYFVVTVYAEVSYSGLVKLMDALNPIVEKYDSDAYFDADTPGRCSAYIDPDNIPSNMYPYDDIQNSEKIYSSQSQYTNRTVLKYKNKSFTIYDNSDSINLPADADFEALRKWKAQISQHAGPYNDADEDYEWASLSNGVVSYYRRGKLVDKSYYMSPSDWGVETLGEWSELVINDVIENLYEANRDIPDHMVYNSTDIEDVSAGDNPMSFRYKGRRIKLLTDGTGYAIYEKGEMIDYGFKSLEDAEAAIDEYDDIYQDDVQVYSATNDGEGYWFFTTHGVQPGSVPRDVDILDIIDTPNGSFVKFDRFLSTKELSYYDMVEKAPKSVMSAEVEDYINRNFDGVTSATEEDYDEEELQDIIDELTADGFDVTDEADLLMGLGADLGMDHADARYYAKLILNHMDDSSVLGAEEDEEDLPMVDQEYDSAATSINSNKLPAIYKMVNFNEGDVIVDFGGGKFDNAVEYIRDKGATLCVYDPYNRSAEHNREVLRILRENGGADAAVNSNVLNVIKEPEARKNVLENIARITKPGAPIYITVYEGKGNGQEGPTKSGYQLNRKTADYLEEIQEVFPDATRRGKLITAHNTGSVTSSTDIQSSSTILCSYDEFLTWYDNLSDEEQWKVDDIADTNGIPFYEEASDDELAWLHDVATIEIHASADTVEAADESASNEVELDPEESMIDVNIDQYIIVDSEGSWEYDSDNYDWASSDGEGSDWYSDNGVRLDDPTGVVEKIDELIEPHVPIEPGTYRVQGYVELYYTVSGVYENRYDYTEDDYSSDINSDFGSAEYNKKLSKIEDVKVTKI